MIPPSRSIKLKWLFIMAEQQLKNTKHIASAMKLTDILLSHTETLPPVQLTEEESSSESKELKELLKILSLEVFNLGSEAEEFDLERSDYDYIKSNKVHFLEYKEYENDVDLINMSEVESVDLDEIAEECDQFSQVMISDMFFYRRA